MPKKTIIFVLLCASGLATPAIADSLRCAGHIIDHGMTQDEVLEYCGPPDETSNQAEISWTYLQPGHQMKHVVYFYNNGKVERTESQSQQ